jgi:hypothetical protein
MYKYTILLYKQRPANFQLGLVHIHNMLTGECSGSNSRSVSDIFGSRNSLTFSSFTIIITVYKIDLEYTYIFISGCKRSVYLIAHLFLQMLQVNM